MKPPDWLQLWLIAPWDEFKFRSARLWHRWILFWQRGEYDRKIGYECDLRLISALWPNAEDSERKSAEEKARIYWKR
jgi:hypothetical protein